LRDLLANTGDTVLGNRNNYFALDMRDDRRWVLPWDLDDMFRPFPQIRAPETPFVHACAGGAVCAANRLGQHTRDNPEIRRRYLEIMCQLGNGVARESRLLDDLLALDSWVRPILATEVDSVWRPLGRDPLNAAVEGTYAAEVERMKTWIPARIKAVRAMIEAEGVPCAVGCEEGAVAGCKDRGRASQRVCSGGHWGSCESRSAGTAGAGSGGAGAGRAGSSGAGADGASGSGGIAEDRTPAAAGCGCALAAGPGQTSGASNRGTLVCFLFALVALNRSRPRRSA
jgi:hypothetical protein